jgi:hypothetical protein
MSGISHIGNRPANQFSSRGDSLDLCLPRSGGIARKKQTGEGSYFLTGSWTLDALARCGSEVLALLDL